MRINSAPVYPEAPKMPILALGTDDPPLAADKVVVRPRRGLRSQVVCMDGVIHHRVKCARGKKPDSSLTNALVRPKGLALN